MLKVFIVLTIVLITFSCSDKRSGKTGILIFSKRAGYHHESIAAGNAAMFEEICCGRFFKYGRLMYWIIAGKRHLKDIDGGFMDIHAATDGEYDRGYVKVGRRIFFKSSACT